MTNNLCAQQHNHAEETFLPTADDDWKKVAEHLGAIGQQADAICHNCATLVWRQNATIKVPATRREDLRAWRVFSNIIKDMPTRDTSKSMRSSNARHANRQQMELRGARCSRADRAAPRRHVTLQNAISWMVSKRQ